MYLPQKNRQTQANVDCSKNETVMLIYHKNK